MCRSLAILLFGPFDHNFQRSHLQLSKKISNKVPLEHRGTLLKQEFMSETAPAAFTLRAETEIKMQLFTIFVTPRALDGDWWTNALKVKTVTREPKLVTIRRGPVKFIFKNSKSTILRQKPRTRCIVRAAYYLNRKSGGFFEIRVRASVGSRFSV